MTFLQPKRLQGKTVLPETILLGMINETYIDARYPGDLGLLPHGKPAISEIEPFIQLCDTILYRLRDQLG